MAIHVLAPKFLTSLTGFQSISSLKFSFSFKYDTVNFSRKSKIYNTKKSTPNATEYNDMASNRSTLAVGNLENIKIKTAK